MSKQCTSCGGFCGKVCQRENVAQQRAWVGLTDREKAVIVKMLWKNNFFVALEAVEAKLKEKNT
jgi:hypothetical protein